MARYDEMTPEVREKLRAYRRQYYAEHKAELDASARARRDEHHEEYLAYTRAQYAKHGEEYNAARRARSERARQQRITAQIGLRVTDVSTNDDS